nr:MAG: hypothetical protein [Bacteriophage sp.]
MKVFKESTYWSIWGDCCNLHKAFYGIKEEDAASWEKAVGAATEIQKKYKQTSEAKFAEALTLLVVSELEHKAKLQKGGTDNAEKKQKSGTGTGNTPA